MSRTQHPISLLAATLAAMATVAALAGCSAAAPSSSTKAASSSSSTQSSAAASKKLDICGLLPVATVAQITGAAVTTATPDHTLEDHGTYSCKYQNDAGDLGVFVFVATQQATTEYDFDYQAAGSTGDISGVGDKAWVHQYGADALFGDVNINVATTADTVQDGLKNLLLKIHSVI